ncbi:uncharacterized protein LOC112046141 [Bicyclus anynana]|uniref:Uncharacterized protein LOC112046141 n=1 Tax=Bicyclus anynana TaxID=110368 RepID=A0A6J1MZS6_BICAN|nr:uncharacterized protein LOC112046141 [Bicyclus anynana]XP_052746184.1 uncharacterized protein LOC112046141 [Bicyclus anynana]
MVRSVYATLLVLSVTAQASSQFFDFFSALQPVGQPTLRPFFQLDITTKRARTTKRPTTTTKRAPYIFVPIESTKRPQTTEQKTKNSFYSTTAKPTRKTTKNTRRIDTSRDTKLISKETSRNNNGSIQKPKQIGNTRNVNVNAFNNDKSKSLYSNNDDRLIFDDGKRNTVINYDTTKSYINQDVTKKNQIVYARPGVKPMIVNGPPITNRPVTQRPFFGPHDDDVTPELIIGPNEDFMSTVDKKRHIEVLEKMCDRYKSLDVKQVQAIPLLPSPDAVRVNVSTCAPQETPLIVGGKVASIQQFRHMALLGWTNLQHGGYSWKCGGSLVSNRFVLTAGHCAYQDRDNSVALGPPKVVQLGSSSLGDPAATLVKVAAVVRHPKYKVPKSYYDIALVKMAHTISFSSLIRPACLGIPPAPGRPIIATGWGKTEFGGDLSQELRSVSLPIWDITECYEALGTSRRLPEGPDSDSQICAGERRGGKDTCQGDSGGPAQIQDGCTWRVVAVTSLGRSCGAVETPALYAKVPRAFVSAVVFGDNNQQSNNNQWSTQQQTSTQKNNNQQWNNQPTNQWNTQQQSNNQKQNNNQQTNQWNTQQTNNQKQNNNQQTNQWNTQQTNNQKQNNQQWNNQPSNQWNTQQQTSTQKQITNQQWNNQPSNQWNTQQQSNNKQNWNNNQEESWTWNRQGNYNQESNNGYTNNNVKRNDQNNYYNQNEYNVQKQHENNYNQNHGSNYNSDQSSNVYTTKKPTYNQNYGYSNSYTEQPVYNQHNAYTLDNPVYNQQNGYTTEKPKTGYNSQSGYYSGYEEPSGYRNDDRVWWT